MMKFITLFLFIVLFESPLFAQDTSNTKSLNEIILTAFENNRKLIEIPAAISYINQKQLLRFNNTSLLNAMNTTPGVKMEERSPGSYRLSIRGSSLRSPFGVRNIKIYLNGIPFTEPGGTTYLNQLGFFNVQSVEILKGPSGSLYGAGNGGTVLLKTYGIAKSSGVGVDYSFGSFGLQNINLYTRFGKANSQQTINYNRLQSNGYRDWTKLNRDVISWDAHFAITNGQLLHAFIMYGDLFYQTPGGLTPQEFAANPVQSRPAAGQFPGSRQANASIRQKTFFSGVSYEIKIGATLKNTNVIYGAISNITNPAIRNYEKRSEPNTGGRTFFTYQPKIHSGELKIIAGTELQRGWYNIRVYKNKNGISDSLQTEDKVNPFIWSSFVQADWKLPHNWVLTAGASLNKSTIAITRLSSLPITTQKRSYTNEIAPRIALLKKIVEPISVYIAVAKGFSPPTTAEVLPSTGVITTSLNAEEGWNYETGVRANILKGKLFTEINTFLFTLNNAIVQRRDAAGADFFTNAGATSQKGIEGYIKYTIVNKEHRFISQYNTWLSYTFSDFKYKDFKKLTDDYSGKFLPGVPKSIVAAGMDVLLKPGAYVNITYNYNETTPLNDANTFYATDFHLLNIKLGYKIVLGKVQMELFGGAENIFDETYSLGNDINAAANRFFNVSAARNYYAGISLFKKTEKTILSTSGK